jgi:hypothetical protein
MIIKLIRKTIILGLAALGVFFILNSFSGMTGNVTGMTVGKSVLGIDSIMIILGVSLVLGSLLLFIQLKIVEKKERSDGKE